MFVSLVLKSPNGEWPITYTYIHFSLVIPDLKRSYKQIKRSIKPSALNRALNKVFPSLTSYAEIAKGIEDYTAGARGPREVKESSEMDCTKLGPTES